MAANRYFARLALLLALVCTFGCKGCDVVESLIDIDVKQFYPDMPADEPDLVVADVGVGPTDTGRRPKDTNFEFDFGSPDDAGEEVFALQAVVPNFGPLTGGNRVRIHGSALSPDARVFVGTHEMTVELSGGALVGAIPPGAGPGATTVKVIAPDGSVRALVDGYTYVETLRVDTAVPNRVPTTGGVEIELRGAGFSDVLGVSFGTDPALRVSVLSGGLARVIVPPRARGFADLRVTTPSNSIEVEDAIFYYEPLKITAVEPASGMVGGGEAVTVRGEGFTSSTRVVLGGAEATVDAIDPQAGTVRITTPPHPAGSVHVTVQNDVDSAVRVNGFYYREDDSPALAGVEPAFGPTTGGNTVRVTGWGLDAAGSELQFGGQRAMVVTAQPSFADVVVPAGAQGVVDVSLSTGGFEDDRLAGAYTYVRALSLTGATPNAGPDTGGTSVTLTGSGFTDAETVLVGGIPADFTVNSDQEIVLTTPPHVGGTVDIVVERDGLEERLRSAFTYEASLEIWGFTPVRGAIAGGTYVAVRGRGFAGEIGVTLDGTAGTGVRRLDRNNLYFYTPPHLEGEAELAVTAGTASAVGPYSFLYFDPAARFGGASGGAVEGAVNVTVFANGGGPIENAFVMLSTRPDTPYQGWTDANGQLTLSGRDVLGAQTTTATAAGFSTTTIDTVDSENITLFLNQLDPSSGSGTFEPPPFGIITGNIRSNGKLADPDDASSYDMAVVATTQRALYASNPPPGPDSIVLGEGRYRIQTRIGDMAIVGLCGTYHEPTDSFTPLFMAVERFVFVADKDELEIDLLCDIPLDQTHTYKLVNAPYAPSGPNNNVVEVYWDFGFEGFFPSPSFGQGFSSLVRVENQPALAGPIADISFTAQGGAFTGFGAPFSSTRASNITVTNQPIELPPLLDVPEPVSPLPGQTVQNGMLRFQASGPYYPDFQYLVLRNDLGIPVWTVILPGDATNVKLPEFPDFSALPPAERPSPVVGGQLYLTIVGARVDGGHAYERFSYRDIDQDLWQAYSLTSWLMRLK